MPTIRTIRSALIALILGAAAATGTPAAAAEPATPAPAEERWIDVPVGQSHIFKGDRSIGRVLASNPEVASIKLLEQGQVQILGQSVGATDLWVWYQDDMSHPIAYDLTVHRDLSDLVRRIDSVVSGAPPRVYPLDDRIAVEGPVDSVETLERITELARVYDEEFVNLMAVTGDHQIQLQVVFAEVNRTALRELGMNGSLVGKSYGVAAVGPNRSTSAFASNASIAAVNNGVVPAAAAGTFQYLGAFGDPTGLLAILSVLEQHNVSRTLAQPTLTALSGQQAEFLAGGEIPIPVAQFGSRISLEFKEYGVKLVFVPTVLGNEVVDMRVYVEVSDVDSSTGIRVTGIEVPGFVSRKTESHIRVESGMTVAMAGMLSESTRATFAKVPILGDIPVIGAAFRYVQHRRNETELMIFVTPRLVRPMAPGEVPAAPGQTEDFNPNDFELFLLGMDHHIGSRTAEPTGPTGPVGLAR
jgi:pilus assembly protein CpaC